MNLTNRLKLQWELSEFGFFLYFAYGFEVLIACFANWRRTKRKKKERTQFKVPIGKYSRGEYGVWVFGCLDVVMSRCMDVRVFTYREIMAPSLALPRS